MRTHAVVVVLVALTCGCPQPTSDAGGDLDLWPGNYSGEKLSVELELTDGALGGTVTQGDQTYPLTVEPKGKEELSGSFTVGEDSFACTLKMTKQGLDFTTGDSTYALVQDKSSKNPLDQGGGEPKPANPLDSGGEPKPANPLDSGGEPKPANPLETSKPSAEPKPANPLETSTPSAEPKPANPLETSTPPAEPKPANPLETAKQPTAPQPTKPQPANPLEAAKQEPAPDPSVSQPGEATAVNPWGADWTEFKHPTGISFRHPSSWRTQEIEGGVTLTPPDAAKDPQGNPLEVYFVGAELANGLSDPAGAQVQQWIRQQIDPQFPALKSTGAPARRELRGRTIGVYGWSGTSPQNGLAIKASLYAAIEGKFAYFLFGLGADDRVAQRSAYLEAVVASFGYTAPPKDERLTGYWRHTDTRVSGSFSMVTDLHLRLDADGTARFASQSGGGDANSSILTEDTGWTKTGTWRTEGKQLYVDWTDGTQLSAPYICDGSSLLLKRSSGKQIYERVR